jgi:hypothetical protein
MSEMSRKGLAKMTQTILYIPHFLSNVIIFGIIFQVFGPTGAVNNVLRALGNTETIGFLTNVTSWRLIYWGSAIWEGAGYGMIVYLAAIAGINTELYGISVLLVRKGRGLTRGSANNNCINTLVNLPIDKLFKLLIIYLIILERSNNSGSRTGKNSFLHF